MEKQVAKHAKREKHEKPTAAANDGISSNIRSRSNNSSNYTSKAHHISNHVDDALWKRDLLRLVTQFIELADGMVKGAERSLKRSPTHLRNEKHDKLLALSRKKIQRLHQFLDEASQLAEKPNDDLQASAKPPGRSFGGNRPPRGREGIMATFVSATIARNIVPTIGDVLNLILQFHSNGRDNGSRSADSGGDGAVTVESVEAEKNVKHTLRCVTDIVHSVLTFGRIRNNGYMEKVAFGIYRKFVESDCMKMNPELRDLFDKMVASRITRFIYNMCKAKKGIDAEEAFNILLKWRSYSKRKDFDLFQNTSDVSKTREETKNSKMGMSLDLVTFNALLSALLARGRTEFAQEFITQSKTEFGITPNLETYHIFLRHLLRSGDTTRAYWILSQMLHANRMDQDRSAFLQRATLHAVQEEGGEEHNKKRGNVQEDIGHSHESNDVNADNSSSEAEEPSTLKPLDIPVTETSIPKPSMETFLLFIRSNLITECEEEVDGVLQLMGQLNMAPTIDLWNTLLEHFIRVKQLDKAKELVQELQVWTKAGTEGGIEPNNRTIQLLNLFDMESM